MSLVCDAWLSWLYVTAFCLGIAALLWVLNLDAPFWSIVVVSLCIGWCINGAFTWLWEPVEKLTSPLVAVIALTALGFCAALIIAGMLVTGTPWFFFAYGYDTFVIGLFFGIVGFLIFGNRARLLEARAERVQADADRQSQGKLLAETELKLLQAQIEPHFLFNALSNAIGLIHKDSHAAEKVLVNLTTLLRASLDRTREETTSLGQELEIVKSYLEIQATRMLCKRFQCQVGG